MPIKLTDLIARVPAEVEAKVRRVRLLQEPKPRSKKGWPNTTRIVCFIAWNGATAGRSQSSLVCSPVNPQPIARHKPWVESSSPEAVRRAMHEIRRWNEGKLDDFNRRLAAAQQELSPKS
jgi:hypothetical protein